MYAQREDRSATSTQPTYLPTYQLSPSNIKLIDINHQSYVDHNQARPAKNQGPDLKADRSCEVLWGLDLCLVRSGGSAPAAPQAPAHSPEILSLANKP